MPITTDKELLFKSHAAAAGLDESAVREIAEAAELLQYEHDQYLHRADQPLTSAYLIVHGRFRQDILDIQGQTILHRLLTRDSQFGALGAAQADPIPVDVVALEPSAALRLDFKTALAFTRKYEVFGLNLTRLIAGAVQQALMAGRKPKRASIITIFHESPASRELTPRLLGRLAGLGESIKVMHDGTEWDPIDGVDSRSLVEQGLQLYREDVRRQVSEWGDATRIVFDVDANLDPTNAAILLEFSEQVLWCCDAERIDSSTYRLKAMEARAPGWRDKISLVWILDGSSWGSPLASDLRELATQDFKLSLSHLHPNQGRQLVDGLERLVHHLRGLRVGLALGGGGARGMAHIGVLKALEKCGVVVDTIAGTSAGAMTGIIHASGFSCDWATNQFAEDLKPGWLFNMLPHGSHWYLLYKYRRGQFDAMLRKYLSDSKLEQLPIPTHAVTVDLIDGRPKVRSSGDAVRSILESINLPVISKPICREGQALVDGGLVNNVPADVLVREGCNFVIAASVTANLASEFASNRPDTPTDKMKSPSTMQTILRSYLVQSVNMNSVGVQPADIVIEPNVTQVDLSDFSKTKELAVEGERAAMQMVPKIKELLAQVDPQLYPPSPNA